MTVKTPSLTRLRDLATTLGLDMSDVQLSECRDAMAPHIELLNWLESEPENTPAVRYPRTPGFEPEGADNHFNAWARRTSIKGATSGPLAGKCVVVKDNIAVAGVPMANGASVLNTYLPEFDATLVTRILDAGGEILGKAHCEFFSLTGNSHSNWKARKVFNPHHPERTSGGSSSGCGALVGGGVVNMAVGGDQGGSIRIPSAWCGCVGLKPTYGLVPYTGCAPLEMTIDHVGPMTSTVADNALLLEVLAGPDGLDARQREVQSSAYTKALGSAIQGLRIGVLREGFGHPNSDPEVDAKVRAALELFRGLGAIVTEVSVPTHLQAVGIWLPIAYQGATDLCFHGNGIGSNWMGFFPRSLARAQAEWRRRPGELSETTKFVMLLGEMMRVDHGGELYARAQNRRRRFVAEYSRIFEQVDLLAFPTTPFAAPPIAAPNCSMQENLDASGAMATNTLPANLTHHPALSLPCGVTTDRLPIGVSLVARHWQESTIYAAAQAFEQAHDWRRL